MTRRSEALKIGRTVNRLRRKIQELSDLGLKRDLMKQLEQGDVGRSTSKSFSNQLEYAALQNKRIVDCYFLDMGTFVPVVSEREARI